MRNRQSAWATLLLSVFAATAGAATQPLYDVQLYNQSGNYFSAFGTTGTAATQMQLGCGIAVNPANTDIFVADGGNSRIDIWNSSGGWIGAFQVPPAATPSNPCGLAFAPNGNLYVADLNGGRVVVYAPGNVAQTSWSLEFSFGSPGTDLGQFRSPAAIAILPGSSSENFTVYVVDGGNNRVEGFTPGGSFLSQFGRTGTGNGQFTAPSGIALGADGSLLVTDTGNNRIQKFTSSGGYISQFGGTGQVLPHAIAPVGIAVCPPSAGSPYAGRIIASDVNNNRILIYNSGGGYVGQYVLHTSPNYAAMPHAVAFLLNGNQVVTASSVSTLPVPITVQTSPAGLSITVDSTAYTAPQTFNWVPLSSHTIAVTSPQGWGAYVFDNWSDAGAISHAVGVPLVPTTYTARFDTQSQITTAMPACPIQATTVPPTKTEFTLPSSNRQGVAVSVAGTIQVTDQTSSTIVLTENVATADLTQVTFARTVKTLAHATGQLTFDKGCTKTDPYGSNNCSWDWGQSITAAYQGTLQEDVQAGKLIVDLKIDDTIPFGYTCPVCGATCNITIPPQLDPAIWDQLWVLMTGFIRSSLSLITTAIP